MFAVIFKATVKEQDTEYQETVSRMRDLAFNEYGCLDFVAVTEGKQEIAISYWENEEAIIAWKNDSEHVLAQQKGREKWYKNYEVQVLEIKRKYQYTA